MKKGLLLVFGTLALAACSQDVPKRVANATPGKLEVLGVVQLSVSTDAQFASTAKFTPFEKFSAQDVTAPYKFLLEEPIVVTLTQEDFKNNRRYITNIFRFTNSSGTTLENAMLVAFAGNTTVTNTGNSTLANSNYYTIGGTNLAEIRSVGLGPVGTGTGQTGQRLTADKIAQCIKPAHTISPNNLTSPTNTLVSPISSGPGVAGVDYLGVEPFYADLQFLIPSELQTVQAYLNGAIPTENPRALSYGFAIHTDTQGRTLTNTQRGTVAVTYALDRGSSTVARPARYQFNFLVVNQAGSTPYLTQSLEEQTSSTPVLTRGAALSAGNANALVSYRAFKGSSNPVNATLFSDAPLIGEYAVVTADLRGSNASGAEAPGTISATPASTVTLGQYVNCY